MSYDLTNQFISNTFGNLLQKTGSDGSLYDLKGNQIGDIRISGSLTAQEYIEHNINIIITDLTIMSALKNKLNNEKSAFVPNSTAFAAISASMLTHHT